MIIGIIIAIAIICIILAYIIGNKKAKQPAILHNEEVLKERDKILQEKEKILQDKEIIQQAIASLSKEKDDYDHKLYDLQSQVKEKEAFIKNCSSVLEEVKQAKEHELELEYNNKKVQLQKDYENTQLELDAKYKTAQKELQETQSELESLKNTRIAIIEAHKREEELSNDDFYVLQIPEDELNDIHYLERIKHKLNFPIVIGKIIWTTFIQKKMNSLAARVLPKKVTVGIYKITNINTSECYIGQSVDIRQRFIDHCKAGIGAVEASMKNKLYSAIRNEGIENFAFELLEECDRSQLNEKERYYIDLYSSDEVGYNSVKGIS